MKNEIVYLKCGPLPVTVTIRIDLFFTSSCYWEGATLKIYTYLRIFQHTPVTYPNDPQPTVYEEIPFIWEFGDDWGMLQRYVGFS